MYVFPLIGEHMKYMLFPQRVGTHESDPKDTKMPVRRTGACRLECRHVRGQRDP